MRKFAGYAILGALLGGGNLHASNQLRAHGDFDVPPSYEAADGKKIVFVDFEKINISYEFDVSARRAKAHVIAHFMAPEVGYPVFDIVHQPRNLRLNGEEIAANLVEETTDPHKVARYRVLRVEVPRLHTHVLEFDFDLSSSDVTFGNGSVAIGFFTSDLSTRNYFEKYGLANFEYDQIQYTIDVNVTGTDKKHTVYANGAVENTEDNAWTVTFPDYFTASSMYFHLTSAERFYEDTFTFEGKEKNIDVVVYAGSSSLVRDAVGQTKKIMTELESTYGAYAHDKLVIYVTPSGGGMEYCGATMTSLWALGHELTHSWFARGVMPSSGNSGWIDEAIASWRDDGYPRARSKPNRSPVNLGNFSPYKRETTRDAYTLGSRLISELDYMFASQGGMRSVLRSLFAEKQRQPINVAYFQSFIETQTGEDLRSIFNRYVYGRNAQGEVVAEGSSTKGMETSHHPRPYTAAELAEFR